MDFFHAPNPVSLIVAERDAEWSSWVARFETGTPDVRVVVQEPGESLDAWAVRVRAAVEELDDVEEFLARAVMVAGTSNSQTISARSLAVRALVGPMVARGEGSVLLDGNTADRFGMMALAQMVSMQIAGTGVTIRATDVAVAHVA